MSAMGLGPSPQVVQVTTECKVCGKPLGSDSRNEGYQLCHGCRKCKNCFVALSAKETSSPGCVFQDLRNNGEWLVQHSNCDPEASPEDVSPEGSVESIEIPADYQPIQTKLDEMNTFRLMLTPDPRLSIESNRQLARNAVKPFIHEMTPDAMLLMVSKVEAIMAELSTLLAKNMVSAKAITQARDKEKFEEAQRERTVCQERNVPKTIKKSENKQERAARVFDLVAGGDKDASLNLQRLLQEKLKGI